MLRWLLFGTQVGGVLLALFERVTKLALVDAEELGRQRCGMPIAQSDG